MKKEPAELIFRGFSFMAGSTIGSASGSEPEGCRFKPCLASKVVLYTQILYRITMNHNVTAAQATLHCLTGCVIGEVTGLLIGVSLGLGALTTIVLATVLAYVSGFTLGVVPVMKRNSVSFIAALKAIWVGEVLSIGVMEIAMNLVDYTIGGVQASSVFAPIFWIGILFAVPAGFLAAWPVNAWLLKRNLKHCH